MDFKLNFLLLLVSPLALLADDSSIRVAVFEGDGVGQSCEQLIASLQAEGSEKFKVSRVAPEEIQGGKLAEFDVLAHPGGSGSKQGNALGEKGREAVRQFVEEGGGFLGVCAGAYLATNDYKWSLNLIDAKVVDRWHWARGKGDVTLNLSPAGVKLFDQESDEMEVYYAQGPLLGRQEWDDPEVPDYESLAIYATEIAKNGAPRGVMARTSAAVRTTFGKGRVFCFSPHPEMTEGLEGLVPLTVNWLAAGDTKVD